MPRRSSRHSRDSATKKPLNYEAIRSLLDAGADMHQKTEGGKTVREFAGIIAHAHPGLTDLFDEYA